MSEELYESASDEISFRPYIEALARYRRVIALSVLGAITLFAIGALGAYLILPKEHLAGIQFRLLFTGAEQNRYPNGTPFNAAEIVSSPVLTEVYQANDLKRHLTIRQLQDSIFVLHSSRAMQQLDRTYLAKLSDTKLTPVDRAKLEDEFAQKRESLRDPEYTLTLRTADSLTEMPRELQEKILSDTLQTWATQAAVQKGATRPLVDVFSRDVFARAADENETFLVRIDVLRTGAQRMIKALHALQEIPGARAARTQENRSLADELATIEDILKFDIEPLMGLARVGGRDSEDRLILLAYISNQLVTYRLNLKTAMTRAQNLQTSLRDFMAQRGGQVTTSGSPGGGGADSATAPVTQLGDSFIDRLLELSSAAQGPESEYRRGLTDKYIEASDEAAAAEREIGYYDDLLKQVSAPSTTPLSGRLGKQLIDERFTVVLKTLTESVDRIQRLFEVISTQTLNPTRQLYVVTQPFMVQTTTVIPFRILVAGFAMMVILALVGSVAGSLVHAHRRMPLTAAGRQERDRPQPLAV